MNFLEQYELKQAARQEAKAKALQALTDHLAVLSDRNRFADFDHPYHAGARSATEFAITLVKVSI